MRIRNRTTVSKWVSGAGGTLVQSNVYCSGTPATDTTNQVVAAYQVPVEYVEERISDSLGRKTSHPVCHRTKKVSLGDETTVVYSNVVGGRSCVSSYGPSPSVANYQTGFAGYFFPWDVSNDASVPGTWTVGSLSISEESLKNDVLELANQLKADLLLNLIEANQIWPSIKSLASSLPNMALHWYNLRNVLKSAGGGYLAWKFGVSPILQDMMSVHRYLPKIRKDMDGLRNQEARRYSRMAELAASSSSPTLDTYQNVEWEGKVIEPPRLRYVLVVKPNTKYLSPAIAAADAFLSRFATSPASLAWELVPFSFVVDWFVDLRGVLRAIDAAIGFTPYQIVSFTRSFSYHLSNTFQAEFYSPCDSSVIQMYPKVSLEFKHYERSLVSELGFLPAWKPHFGKNQAAISAALIIQELSKANWVRSVSRSVRLRKKDALPFDSLFGK
jgi:hypothetical protein